MRITKYRTELNEDKLNVLVKENAVNYTGNAFDNPKKIVDMINGIYGLNRMAEEYVYMVGFSTKNIPLGVFEISHGAVDFSILNPREIFIRALLCGATSFAVIHNHPSGDCSPSKDDITTTKNIQECSKIMKMPFLDHIIIGEGDSYYSMKEFGVL